MIQVKIGDRLIDAELVDGVIFSIANRGIKLFNTELVIAEKIYDCDVTFWGELGDIFDTLKYNLGQRIATAGRKDLEKIGAY